MEKKGIQSKAYLNAKPVAVYDGSYSHSYPDGCGNSLTVTTTCTGSCSQAEMEAHNQAYEASWPRLENGCYGPVGPQTPQ